MEAIEAAARALREEAQRLLDETGLLALLERYGKPNPTGSFTTDLMVWRDLDIELISDDLSVTDFFRLGGDIAGLLHPARMHYRDENIMGTPGLPLGRYWGVYLPEPNGWKVDLWAVGRAEQERRSGYSRWLRETLTPDSRRTILRIKAAVWNDPGYRIRFSSTDIYDAVITKGVTDIDAFLALVAPRKDS